MSENFRRGSLGPLASIATLTFAGIVGALVLGDSDPEWLALGAVCWVLAVALKVPIAGLIELLLPSSRHPATLVSAFSGLNSAASELGVTTLAYLLWRFPENLAEAAAVGLGAGTIEVVIVAGTGVAQLRRGTAGGLGWIAVLERLLAVLGHVGSRALIWVSLAGGELLLAVAAIGLFAAVDGTADYGLRRKWDWSDRRTLRRYYGFVAGVTALEFAAVAAGRTAV